MKNVLVILLFSSLTCTARAGGQPDIVLVVLDEFSLSSLLNSKGEINRKRFPNFYQLSQEAHWFKNATTAADDTVTVIPAVLTARLPKKKTHVYRKPHYKSHPNNILKYLSKDYHVRAKEVITQLSPRKKKIKHSRLIGRKYLRAVLKKVRGLDRQKRFIRFIDGIKSRSRPTFHFLHTLLPHSPWQYYPSGKSYSKSPVLTYALPNRVVWTGNEMMITQGVKRYLMQVGYVDTLLGRLVQKMKDTGIYDKSILIITADHGVAFRRGHYRRKLSPPIADEVLPIPLFVKTPGQTSGSVSMKNVQNHDIAPTIAELLGRKLPWKHHGISMFSERTRAHKVAISFYVGKVYKKYKFPATIDISAAMATYRRRTGEGSLQDMLLWPQAESGKQKRQRFKLARPSLLRKVQPESTFVPGQLVGRFRGKGYLTEPVMALLNGKFAGWAVPVGGNRFQVLAPESSFVKGRNKLTLLKR